MMAQNESETKIFYYVDDEETPYLMKIPIPLADVTLQDFKNALQRTNYKFFFKTLDADFGVVKEEILDDTAVLPAFKGRVVSWLVPTEGSILDNGSQTTTSACSDKQRRKQEKARYAAKCFDDRGSSVLSSDVESSTVLDSDSDTVSTTTDQSSVSKIYQNRFNQMRKRRRQTTGGSSLSDESDSTVSLNIVEIVLSLETVNFLGITVVGPTTERNGGIYVGTIMRGGAVALDGRIEPGDMLLQVNNKKFQNMTNDEAVKVLRAEVQTPGPVKLVIAKNWGSKPRMGHFTIPRTEEVCPIDPEAWVAHTEAALAEQFIDPNEQNLRPPSVSTVTSSNYGPETELNPLLSLSMDNSTVQHIVEVMASPNSGLDVRDRTWLKITIKNAFLGSDCVEWLLNHVQGFSESKAAKKYASRMLKEGFIKHTVNKTKFSKQRYYVFNEDLVNRVHDLRLDSRSGPEQPCIPIQNWPVQTMPPYVGNYIPQPYVNQFPLAASPTYAEPTAVRRAAEANYVNIGPMETMPNAVPQNGYANSFAVTQNKARNASSSKKSSSGTSSTSHDVESSAMMPSFYGRRPVSTSNLLSSPNDVCDHHYETI